MTEDLENAFDSVQRASDIRESVNITKIAKDSEDLVDIPTVRESSVVKDYLEGNLTGNTAAKKVIAAALTVANKKGYIKLPEKYSNPESIAIISDKALETIKLGCDVATGKMDEDEAADYMVKKGAAVLKTVADRVIDRGKEFVTSAFIAAFPSAREVASEISAVANFVGEKLKPLVHEGIDMLADVVKPKLGNWIAEARRKIREGVEKTIFG